MALGYDRFCAKWAAMGPISQNRAEPKVTGPKISSFFGFSIKFEFVHSNMIFVISEIHTSRLYILNFNFFRVRTYTKPNYTLL